MKYVVIYLTFAFLAFTCIGQTEVTGRCTWKDSGDSSKIITLDSILNLQINPRINLLNIEDLLYEISFSYLMGYENDSIEDKIETTVFLMYLKLGHNLCALSDKLRSEMEGGAKFKENKLYTFHLITSASNCNSVPSQLPSSDYESNVTDGIDKQLSDYILDGKTPLDSIMYINGTSSLLCNLLLSAPSFLDYFLASLNLTQLCRFYMTCSSIAVLKPIRAYVHLEINSRV